MPDIEEELRAAISYRSEMAVELAQSLLRLASEDGVSVTPTISGEGGIVNGGYGKLATDIEALTAVILQRAGVPWDALAAPTEISKQALHRRLHSRGEALFAEAISESDLRETDPRQLIRFLRKAKRVADDPLEISKVLEPLPINSELLIWNLVRMPKPEDIIRAPTKFARTLSILRKIPLWWWDWE